MEKKGQVQEILCGKIGHDLLMATGKKEKVKIILCPVANEFSRSWQNFTRLFSPASKLRVEMYIERTQWVRLEKATKYALKHCVC